MDARDLSSAFTLIMEDQGWTQTDLARHLGGVTQPWVSNVIHEKRDPPFAKVCAMLRRVGWEVRISPKQEESLPVKRRVFNSKIAWTAAGVTFVSSPRTGPYDDPEYVQGLASRLYDMREEQGGLTLAPIALRHVRRIEHVINGRDQRLQRSASDLARAASLALFDAGRQNTAANVANLGLVLAYRSDWIEGAVFALENLSCFSQRSDPARAAMLAEKALNLPDLPSKYEGRLNIRLAASQAHVRERDRRAQLETFSMLEHGMSLHYASSESRGIVAGHVGIALDGLGRHSEAQRSFATAMQLYERSPHTRSLYVALSTHAAMRSGDVEMTANLLRALARITPLIMSARLEQWVRRILADLEPWARIREIRQARDELQAPKVKSRRRDSP